MNKLNVIKYGLWQIQRRVVGKRQPKDGQFGAALLPVLFGLLPQSLHNRFVALYYKFVGSRPKEATKMLEELRRLRYMQEFLLNCLIWEPKGKLSKDIVLKEIWDIIE